MAEHKKYSAADLEDSDLPLNVIIETLEQLPTSESIEAARYILLNAAHHVVVNNQEENIVTFMDAVCAAAEITDTHLIAEAFIGNFICLADLHRRYAPSHNGNTARRWFHHVMPALPPGSFWRATVNEMLRAAVGNNILVHEPDHNELAEATVNAIINDTDGFRTRSQRRR